VEEVEVVEAAVEEVEVVEAAVEEVEVVEAAVEEVEVAVAVYFMRLCRNSLNITSNLYDLKIMFH
jgi:hypothetical protein